MSAQTTVFFKTLRIVHTPEANYGWQIMVKDDEGSTIFLTDAQADELACLLWNRNCPQEKVA